MLRYCHQAFAACAVITTVGTIICSHGLFKGTGQSYPRRLMGAVDNSQSSGATSSIRWPKCKERRRVAFVKNHKVGGDTVKNILNRYGYTRKLNFLLPHPFVASMTYPYSLYPEFYLPVPPNQTFDMLVYHTVYNRTRFRQVLPKDTVYLTIIREPLSHLKSIWNYYGLQNRFLIRSNGEHAILTFLNNPEKYDKSCGHGRHVPYCLTQNSMSVDLGFPAQNNKRVTLGCDREEREVISQTFLRKIHDDFHLVMITEYFDESLVLLKRLMCWTLQDILYYKANVRHYATKRTRIPPDVRQIHNEWSYVDYALYHHFNQTFWRRVHAAGNDFLGEVRYFRRVNHQMRELCDSLSRPNPCPVSPTTVVVNDTRWSPGFTIDRDFCLLAKRDLDCYYSLQAERAAKALKLNHSNIHLYGGGGPRPAVISQLKRWTETESRKDAMYDVKVHKLSGKDVVGRHCLYCNLANCRPFDYLTHFYKDGHISNDSYRTVMRRINQKIAERCNMKNLTLP
ncbi:galactose-3-O-sulfotransferase 3-like [Branchiostoma floridae]|uniref:Galactose-3-O-sulfotransferase 3-like n=1 Tax=Branchiostoma floridae TaxID=7739 RepID=A0A9J7L5X9_BRAFL|nr:galactose-3-O-sulfotransferase 3-like [Branchiostoma floridae]XP_035676899.1 galactose-3-O-sulfotransferase 3-like [Branchiostoma floridae]XP_035676900.1 galactose-3-O-sulfotransferase 3-like [Branchiostoma floridae]